MSEKYVFVRRDSRASNSIGKILLDDLHNLRWDTISGGFQARQPSVYLFGTVCCTKIIAENFGHSGLHGPCPHDIKVCITKKDNLPKIYTQLAAQAGSKPASNRRKPLTKAEKASRLYLIWGTPPKNKIDLSHPLLPEEYYTLQLILDFIRHCKKRKLHWAILSPTHGVWKDGVKKIGSEKRLREASSDEQEALIKQIQQCAMEYKKLLVYSGRCYDRTDLHRELIQKVNDYNRISLLNSFLDIR
ncbi:hypothetical protein KL86SPO_50327 [uncultured Sporomusa sp.]|uniref:Uncharacterized protein n=1 Tax=uncultured Sporomusa sp. TaxID=307249 RepID=A0A212LYG4_9FIRM|nr:hypothetical protein [uncultured Sporomusa sp.]SCM82556.1 hypothetical protein KL86SPO_50327 [uncultured Sporomusa sp.]